MIEFFIPTNTPSSKNSKVWTGSYLVNSKAVNIWKKNTKGVWLRDKQLFLDSIKDLPKPYFIYLIFIRKSKHKFDYINIAQVIKDAMKEHGWIDDDNADEVVTVFGKYRYNKQNPGCIIRVLKEKPQYEFL